MLMFLLGFPSQFRQWCEALIVQLAERASGSLLCSSAGCSEGLLQAMIEHPSQHILFRSSRPVGCIGYLPQQMGDALSLSPIREFGPFAAAIGR